MRRALIAAALAAGFAAVTPAHALTPIYPNAYEPDLLGPDNGQDGILDHLYGLENLSRIDDSADRLWSGLRWTVVARARYAADRHEIGYVAGGDGGTYAPLFEVTEVGGELPGGTFDLGPDGFCWMLHDLSTGTYWSSDEAENGVYGDHMVTWEIVGGADHGLPVGGFVLAWEDRAPGDSDFNDLVLEVSRVEPVPEPQGLMLLGTGLLFVSGLALRRSRRAG